MEIVELLVKNGADVNHIDSISNQSALFYASREGNLKICKFLIENGCNYMLTDAKRQTALHWARKFNRKDVVEFLSSFGVNNKKKGNKNEKVYKIIWIYLLINFFQLKIIQEIKKEEKKKEKDDKHLNKKKKREKDESKMPYKLVYTDESGKSTELTEADFENFKNQYPEIANMMQNPDDAITEELLNRDKEKDSWEKVAKKIMNILWKMKGSFIFYAPVDPYSLQIEDYFDIVKNPMDFGTIKVYFFLSFE